MDFFVFNLSWMVFNIILAIVPVAMTMMLKEKLNPIIRGFLLFVWLLFLPNTIYTVTDLQHLPAQFVQSDSTGQVVLILMYTVLTIVGIITFMYSLRPFERILTIRKVGKENKNYYYIALCFLVAFGVILGKVQRTHSWYVFTDPQRVTQDIVDTISSPLLILLSLLFGLVFTTVYFTLRKYFLTNTGKSR